MKRSMFFWSLLAGGMVWGAMVLGIHGADESVEKSAPAAPKPSDFSAEATPGQSKSAPVEEPPTGARKPEPPPSESPKPESPPAPPSLPTPSAKEEGPFPLNSRQAEAAILKALAELSEAEFSDTPLPEVIEYWQKRHKIPIFLDRRACENVGVNVDHPITIQKKACSFRAILEQVLDGLDLTWTIRHESLWITTPEETENRLITRVYDVDDLLPARTEDLWSDLEELVDVITSTVAVNRWDDVGGAGSIRPLIVRGRGFLVIQQTWSIHLEIIQLLEDIREAVRARGVEENGRPHRPRSGPMGLGLSPPTAPPAAAGDSQPTEKKPSFVDKVAGLLERSRQVETELLRALEKPAEAEFTDAPLDEIIHYLHEAYRIPIALDHKELDSVGVPVDKSVSIRVKNVSLRSLLDQLLEPLELSWTIYHESIWITSRDRAQNLLIPRVYPTAELLPAGADEEEVYGRLEKLKEVICKSVSPRTWEDLGGSGSIAVLVVRGKGVLVIDQTLPVHWEIARLLKQLSKPTE